MIWRGEDIAAATGGTAIGGTGWEAGGIAIDNRQTSAGDLFVALEGPNHDGHDYVDAAGAAGAVAALVSHPVRAELPQIHVGNTLDALWALGKSARDRSTAQRIAITGSVGKTGTRHLVSTVLASGGSCHASEGNLNNQIGAPLSLARMPRDSRFGVFELGMNHAGEIAELSPLVSPHIAVITQIAASHIGQFDSLDAIAAAKAEIFTGLAPGGMAIINADDGYAGMLSAAARDAGASSVITIGVADTATHQITRITRRDDGLDVDATLAGTPLTFRLGMMAPHWAYAALTSLAVAHALGLDLDRCIEALAAALDLPGRGQRLRAMLKGQRSITIIDDSYNASPASMAAAIHSLGSDPWEGRRIAILADMLELGEQTRTLHQGLAEDIETAGIDLVICFGPAMNALASRLDAANLEHRVAADAEGAISLAFNLLEDGDLVLIKGSNGMRTRKVVDALVTGQPNPSGESHAA
ncbi:UDP-N-acetylmuramoyl-tripeptide--D-alanyl-D-alanine ligase [Alphaproteobacteria bacterium LSUCC0684]